MSNPPKVLLLTDAELREITQRQHCDSCRQVRRLRWAIGSALVVGHGNGMSVVVEAVCARCLVDLRTAVLIWPRQPDEDYEGPMTDEEYHNG